MNEIIFEVIKIVVMVAALVITRYLVPWIREKIGAERMTEVEKWVRFAVLKAQQVMQSETGADKKAYVTQFLKELLMDLLMGSVNKVLGATAFDYYLLVGHDESWSD